MNAEQVAAAMMDDGIDWNKSEDDETSSEEEGEFNYDPLEEIQVSLHLPKRSFLLYRV